MRLVIAIAIGFAAAAAAYALKLPLRFGAHPFWADQALLWGAAIGAILALITSRTHYSLRVLSFTTLTAGAYAVAHIGKMRFAASYAENAFAGQMWFFGWHAVCIFAMATIVTTAYRPRRGA
ncbi:hypothetical protein [Yoonia sp.]|uniref:hypothetical protein n=1 Tax=Yoonia sp. TaxID=2212373 RepID=UPI0025D46754|nr:hypothetical protein [Yoonia sp.]